MHNLLDQYLEDVAAHLTTLPVVRRNEEIKEMRQHLLNATLVNREMGQSEDEAAQCAVEQFGASEELGASLVRVWRREEQKKNTRNFWRMTACFVAVFTLEAFLRPHVIVPYIPLFVFALIMSGWQRLSPNYAPAWWAFQKRPANPAQCWLATARCFVMGFLLLFAGMSNTSLHLAWALGAVMACGVWLRWYWGQRRKGSADSPTGVA